MFYGRCRGPTRSHVLLPPCRLLWVHPSAIIAAFQVSAVVNTSSWLRHTCARTDSAWLPTNNRSSHPSWCVYMATRACRRFFVSRNRSPSLSGLAVPRRPLEDVDCHLTLPAKIRAELYPPQYAHEANQPHDRWIRESHEHDEHAPRPQHCCGEPPFAPEQRAIRKQSTVFIQRKPAPRPGAFEIWEAFRRGEPTIDFGDHASLVLESGQGADGEYQQAHYREYVSSESDGSSYPLILVRRKCSKEAGDRRRRACCMAATRHV
jgi:hypothetical protein